MSSSLEYLDNKKLLCLGHFEAPRRSCFVQSSTTQELTTEIEFSFYLMAYILCPIRILGRGIHLLSLPVALFLIFRLLCHKLALPPPLRADCWYLEAVMAIACLSLGMSGVGCYGGYARSLFNRSGLTTPNVPEQETIRDRFKQQHLVPDSCNDELIRKDRLIQRLEDNLATQAALMETQDFKIRRLQQLAAGCVTIRLEDVGFARHRWIAQERISQVRGQYWLTRTQGSSTGLHRPAKDIDLFRCTVCFGYFEDGEETVRLPCDHRFHKGCLFPWLRTNMRCPRCTRRIGLKPALLE